ncbi:MAG: hypothetical protein IGQ88_06465 [Gloeomargaritaceae cyanobacterium C42_A2020_066]|nr:hypothetical protein [Gloeomargaritaceae cyanobacterium C42_A2020_066]
MRHLLLSVACLTSLGLAPPVLARETVITGENGRAATVKTQRTRDNLTWTRARQVEGSQGRTSSRTRSLTRTGDQSWNSQGQWVGSQGRTTFSTGTWTTNGQGGYTGTSTVTGPQGISRDYQVEGQFSRDPAGRSWRNTATVTRSQGQTRTYSRATDCGNGQCTRVRTGSTGATRTTTATGTRQSGSLSVTGRQGQTRAGTYQRTH